MLLYIIKMKIIKIDIQNIILFTQILTKCFTEETKFLLKDNILDKENKLDNENKIKILNFFSLLEKQDKVFMTLIFSNYNKDIQKYILSFYFHLFLIIKIDELKNVFNILTECVDDIEILNVIDKNCEIHKYLNDNFNIINLETKFVILNNTLHLQLP